MDKVHRDEDDIRTVVSFTPDEVDRLALAMRAADDVWWETHRPGSRVATKSSEELHRDEAREALKAFSTMGNFYLVFLRMSLALPGITERQRQRIRATIDVLSRR